MATLQDYRSPENRKRTRFERAHPSYLGCRICGHEPRSQADQPNGSPLRWWDPDDGWRIGTLCFSCWCEAADDTPKPGDYAYDLRAQACSSEETDEDAAEALD